MSDIERAVGCSTDPKWARQFGVSLPRSHRSLAAEIHRLEARLKDLRRQFARCLPLRNAGMVDDHEKGLSMPEIAVKYDVTYACVANVLHRNRLKQQEIRIRERLGPQTGASP